MNNTLILRGSENLARDTRTVFDLLEKLQGGLLEVRLPDGSCALFGDGEAGVTLQVHDEAMFGRVLARGDIGLAEAYLDGLWDSPDITGLLTLLAANREVLQKALYGSWRQLLAARVRHWLNRNSKAGSKRNIMAHYDLGNAFYSQWLDPSMSYSAAIYRDVDDGSLEAAQHAKYQRILHCLQASQGQSVLEIGCGWGGFAELADQAGLKVTGLTLSPAQLAWAQHRVPAADLRLQDYRDERGRYDRIASIEMIEAVGEQFWPQYFSQLRDRLAPGGFAGIQAITIQDRFFNTYRREVDFIQRYVFPGGMLPSPQVLKSLGEKFGVPVIRERIFGEDYARTLATWRDNFRAAWPSLTPLGFDERFRRLWEYYLAYCEAGFLSGNIDVRQVVFAKTS